MIDKDYIFKVGDKIIADPVVAHNASWHSDFLHDILLGVIVIGLEHSSTGVQVMDVVRISDGKINHSSFKCWSPVIFRIRKYCNLIISPEVPIIHRSRFQLLCED